MNRPGNGRHVANTLSCLSDRPSEQESCLPLERHLRGPLSAELSGFTNHDIIVARPVASVWQARGRARGPLPRVETITVWYGTIYWMLSGLIGAYFGKNNVR